LIIVAVTGTANKDTFAAATFIIATEMIAAGLYGKSLTPPDDLVPKPRVLA
jgi:hypothetical protein